MLNQFMSVYLMCLALNWLNNFGGFSYQWHQLKKNYCASNSKRNLKPYWKVNNKNKTKQKKLTTKRIHIIIKAKKYKK